LGTRGTTEGQKAAAAVKKAKETERIVARATQDLTKPFKGTLSSKPKPISPMLLGFLKMGLKLTSLLQSICRFTIPHLFWFIHAGVWAVTSYQ
jgi:hypothetical protein